MRNEQLIHVSLSSLLYISTPQGMYINNPPRSLNGLFGRPKCTNSTQESWSNEDQTPKNFDNAQSTQPLRGTPYSQVSKIVMWHLNRMHPLGQNNHCPLVCKTQVRFALTRTRGSLAPHPSIVHSTRPTGDPSPLPSHFILRKIWLSAH